MLHFWVRAALSGLIVAAIAGVARRYPGAGALIAALPLLSILGMVWLWSDTHDPALMARHVEATFWYVVPSLPMFLLIPYGLRHGMGFWPTLAAGCVVTIALYVLTAAVAARYGLRL